MANPTLEQAIFDDPDDREAWQVYGDWLQQQNDPRGEIILLELDAEQAEGKAQAELAARRGAVEAEHRSRLLGPLAELLDHPSIAEVAKLEWARGYIVQAQVGNSEEDYDGPPTEEVLAALVRSPAALFLRDLWIGTRLDEEEDWIGLMDGNLRAALGAGPLEALARLTIADTERFWDISSTRVGDVTAALQAAPRLRELDVVGGEIELTPTTHARLTKLRFKTGGLIGATAAALAQSSFPELTSLTLFFGAERYGSSASLADVEPVLTGAQLPKLEHLGLVDAEFQDDVAAAIAASPILPRLRSVDLSLGTMTDAGVAAILAQASRFAHLASLDLSRNYLSAAALAELRAALPGVELVAGDQRQAREYNGRPHYYVSVGE